MPLRTLNTCILAKLPISCHQMLEIVSVPLPVGGQVTGKAVGNYVVEKIKKADSNHGYDFKIASDWHTFIY
jgi:hypothetical protein